MNPISIQMARPSQYESFLSVFSEGFLPKFRFVSPGKGEDCIHDFGLIDLSVPAKYFVAMEEEKILGILILKGLCGEKDSYTPRLSLAKLMKKYGLSSLLRLLQLGWISRYQPPYGEIYIDSIAVSTEARGKGIGTKLLSFIERLARERKFESLSLDVMFENARARELYERMGYRVVKKYRFPRMKRGLGYSGCTFMRKKLAPGG